MGQLYKLTEKQIQTAKANLVVKSCKPESPKPEATVASSLQTNKKEQRASDCVQGIIIWSAVGTEGLQVK